MENNILDSQELNVIYTSHKTNVKEFGEALIGFYELFSAVNEQIAQQETTVNIQIKTITNGSFDITFLIELYNNTKNMFLANDDIEFISRVSNLFSIILKYLKKMKNKIPSLTPRVINALRKITAPLIKDKSSIKMKAKNFKTEITSEDAKFIHSISSEPSEKLISSNIIENYYFIELLTFKRENKWKLSDGESSFLVSIEDKKFLNDIDNQNIAFQKNDRMKCRIKITQWESVSSFRTKFELLEVLEYKHIPIQEKLF